MINESAVSFYFIFKDSIESVNLQSHKLNWIYKILNDAYVKVISIKTFDSFYEFPINSFLEIKLMIQ